MGGKDELGDINWDDEEQIVKGLKKTDEPPAPKLPDCHELLLGYPAEGRPFLKEEVYSGVISVTPTWVEIATWTVPKRRTTVIERLGINDLENDYDYYRFRILINGVDVATNLDIDNVNNRPYGAVFPRSEMFQCDFILGPEDIISVEAMDVNKPVAIGARVVYTVFEGRFYPEDVCD